MANIVTPEASKVLEDIGYLNRTLKGYDFDFLVKKFGSSNHLLNYTYDLAKFFDSLTDEDKTFNEKRRMTGTYQQYFDVEIPEGKDTDEFEMDLYYGHNDVECSGYDMVVDSVYVESYVLVAETTSALSKLEKCYVPETGIRL